jgi:hypothetical protein
LKDLEPIDAVKPVNIHKKGKRGWVNVFRFSSNSLLNASVSS